MDSISLLARAKQGSLRLRGFVESKSGELGRFVSLLLFILVVGFLFYGVMPGSEEKLFASGTIGNACTYNTDCAPEWAAGCGSCQTGTCQYLASGRADSCYCTGNAQCTSTKCDAESSTYEGQQGLNTDNLQCFSDVACTGTALNCGSHDGDCQVDAGAAAACDDYSENSCVGTSGRCDSNCNYITDGDANTETCSCMKGASPTYWNIGGETSAATCCEDAGENRRTRTVHFDVTENGFASDANDDACCNAATDCVYSSTCYAAGGAYQPVAGRGNYCYNNGAQGNWINADYHMNFCTPGGWSWHLNAGDATGDNYPSGYGATTAGYCNEYKAALGGAFVSSTQCCCGDDSNENVLTEQTYNMAIAFDNDQQACCDASTDCVAGTTCYASYGGYNTAGQQVGLNVGGGDNKAYCYNNGGVGSWLDCDQSGFMNTWCANAGGTMCSKAYAGPGNNAACDLTQGGSRFPDALGDTADAGCGCCGDDVNENYIAPGAGNVYTYGACCDAATDCVDTTGSNCINTLNDGNAGIGGTDDFCSANTWYDCGGTDRHGNDCSADTSSDSDGGDDMTVKGTCSATKYSCTGDPGDCISSSTGPLTDSCISETQINEYIATDTDVDGNADTCGAATRNCGVGTSCQGVEGACSQHGPAVGTVNPNSGTIYTERAIETFTATYSDPEGYGNINQVFMLINDAVSGTNALYVRFDYSTDHFYIRNDANDAWIDAGARGAVGEQCNTYACIEPGSTISSAGDVMTVTWNVKFRGIWEESTNIYLYVRDDQANTAGWTDVGDLYIENDIDITTATCDDLTPNPGQTVSCSGTVVYQGSAIEVPATAYYCGLWRMNGSQYPCDNVACSAQTIEPCSTHTVGAFSGCVDYRQVPEARNTDRGYRIYCDGPDGNSAGASDWDDNYPIVALTANVAPYGDRIIDIPSQMYAGNTYNAVVISSDNNGWADIDEFRLLFDSLTYGGGDLADNVAPYIIFDTTCQQSWDSGDRIYFDTGTGCSAITQYNATTAQITFTIRPNWNWDEADDDANDPISVFTRDVGNLGTDGWDTTQGTHEFDVENDVIFSGCAADVLVGTQNTNAETEDSIAFTGNMYYEATTVRPPDYASGTGVRAFIYEEGVQDEYDDSHQSGFSITHVGSNGNSMTRAYTVRGFTYESGTGAGWVDHTATTCTVNLIIDDIPAFTITDSGSGSDILATTNNLDYATGNVRNVKMMCEIGDSTPDGSGQYAENTFSAPSGSVTFTDAIVASCVGGTNTIYCIADDPTYTNIDYDDELAAVSATFDPDDGQSYCEACDYMWNIGGDISGTACCADDASESRIVSTFHASMDAASDASDACCDTATDCVDNNGCYALASVSYDADADGDNDYCGASSTWYDCNTNAECSTSTGYHCVANNCVNTCTANAQCPTGFFCNQGGTCQAQLGNDNGCFVTYVDSDAERNGACISAICDNDGCKKCVPSASDFDGDKWNDNGIGALSYCDNCPTDPDYYSSTSCPAKLAGLIVVDDRASSKIVMYEEGAAWTPDGGQFSEQSTSSFEGTYSTHNRGSWVRHNHADFATSNYPRIAFAYKVNNTELACIMVQDSVVSWREIAETAAGGCSYTSSANKITLINDGKWHVAEVDISDLGTITYTITGGTGNIYLDNVYAIQTPKAYSKPTNVGGATPGTQLTVYSVCTDDDGAISGHAHLINYQDDNSVPNRGYYACSGASVVEAGGSYGQEYTEVPIAGSSCWTKGDAHIMKAVIRTEGDATEYGQYINDISLRCLAADCANSWNHNSTSMATSTCPGVSGGTVVNNYDTDFLTYDCPSDDNAGDTYCPDVKYCPGEGACAADLAEGTACTRDNQCTSGDPLGTCATDQDTSGTYCSCLTGTSCLDDGACYAETTCRDFNAGDDTEYCSSGSWTEQDASETACGTCTGANRWNIGGDSGGATQCCGDDTAGTENRIVSTYHASMDGVSDGSDACCDAASDCVDNSGCYALASVSYDADADGDNDYCGASSTWYDCNTNAQCPAGYACVSNNCVDNTPPTCSVLDITESSAYAYVASDHVWYNTGSTGGFTVNVSSTDAIGMGNVTFPATVSAGAADTSSPYQQGYSWDGADTYSQLATVTCYDAVGNSATDTFNVTRDVAAPTTTISDTNSNWRRTDVAFTLSCADAVNGAGCATSYYKEMVGDVACTAGGYTTYSGQVSLTCSSGSACTKTLCYYSTDRVSNAESLKKQLYRIDKEAPTCFIGLITQSTGENYQHKPVEGVLWYNTLGSGSFIVLVTSTDAASGMGNVTFPDTVSTGAVDTNNPYTRVYSWNSVDTYNQTATVTCRDSVGNSATNTFDVKRDNGAPNGGSITYRDGYYSSESVPITYATGSDTGAGLNDTTGRVERQSATLSGGTCGSWSGYTLLISETDGSHTDATVSSGNCYQYRYIIEDNVDNQANYTTSSIARISTGPPTCVITGITESSAYGYVNGETIYYSSAGTGSWDVAVAATDAGAGISNVTFPLLSSITGSGADSASAYKSSDVGAYSWGGSSTYSNTASVTCYSNSGLSAQDTYTVTLDTTAPTTTISDTNSNWRITDVTFTLACNDGTGSGCANSYYKEMTGDVACTAGGYTTYSGQVSLTCASGSACTKTLCYYSVDNVNNAENLKKQLYRIDKEPPTCSVTGITQSTGTNYQHTTATDVLWYNTAGTGTFYVSIDSTDSASGMGNVSFPVTVSVGAVDIVAPYQRTYTFDNADTYNTTATATCSDSVGNTATDTYDIKRDIAAPAGGSITYRNGYYTALSVPITYTVGADGQSGLNTTSGKIERSVGNLAAGSCAGYGGFTTLVVESDGAHTDNTVESGRCYKYRYAVDDNVDNPGYYISANEVKVQTAAPTCSVSSLTESSAFGHVIGTTVYYSSKGTGSWVANIAATETFTGVSNVTFPAIASITGSGVDTASTYKSSDVSAYSWTLSSSYSGAATATCAANSGLTSQASYTVTRDNDPPSGGSITYTNGYYGALSVPISYNIGADALSTINLSSGRIERRVGTLSGGSCTGWGGFTPLVSETDGSYIDNTVLEGKCYEYRYRVIDYVSNIAYYNSTSTAKIDPGAPNCTIESIAQLTGSQYQHVSVRTLYYNPGYVGSFNVSISVNDSYSGISNVTFPATVSAGSVDTTRPYHNVYNWDTADTYNSTAFVYCYDDTGNYGTANFTVRRDASPPSGGSISYTGGIYNNQSVRLQVSDGSDPYAGVNTSRSRILRRVASINGAACGSYGSWQQAGGLDPSSPYSDTTSYGYCYQYRYEVIDNIMNGINFTSANTVIVNSRPNITAIQIYPITADSDDDLFCNATAVDNENSTLRVEYLWYKDSVLQFRGNRTGVRSGEETVIATVGSDNLTRGEVWNCTIRAFDGLQWGPYASTTRSIGNAMPPKVILKSPTNGNTTVHNRTPEFIWEPVIDNDGDPITYTFNLSHATCSDRLQTNIASTSYRSPTQLCLDSIYHWQVRAHDGTQYGPWSDIWNFTIESLVSIRMINKNVNFGSMGVNTSKNTTTGAVNPLLVENDGNVVVNISELYANASIFSTLALNTAYFQFKVDGYAPEPGSFNPAKSVTSWTNFVGLGAIDRTAIHRLNYNDTNDVAEIDIKLHVPIDEPPGVKRSTIYVTGEVS